MSIFFTLITLFYVSLSMAQDTDSTQLVLGKVNYAQRADFTTIPTPYASRKGMYVQKEVLAAFVRMHKAAQKDGISLVVISAGRSFSHQKRIWEAKWNGKRKVDGQDLSHALPEAAERAKEILKYSSMPGTSRHHWGTDIDINSLNPKYFLSGKGKKEYEWLRDNALEFGFCQVYSEKGDERKYGYEEEKWHWSYVSIAAKLTRYYMCNISDEHLTGFDGAKALSFNEVLKYVNGIATKCR